MLFGQSVFQSVLTRLKEEQGEDEEEDVGASFRIKGLGLGFVAPTDDGPNAATGTEAYFAFLPELAEIVPAALLEPEREPKEPPPPPPIPARLTRLTQEEIAEELAIGPKDTEETLGEKRRQFAKANHPDGVALEFRGNATIRMQTANLLIDTAIKNLFWR